MEDYILKEIDKIGQMLVLIARKLGLFDNHTPHYTAEDVREEFRNGDIPFDLDAVLGQENPVLYLVEEIKLTDAGLEMFMEIVFHSDIDTQIKNALLEDTLIYLDRKGNYSFRLHSLRGIG